MFDQFKRNWLIANQEAYNRLRTEKFLYQRSERKDYRKDTRLKDIEKYLELFAYNQQINDFYLMSTAKFTLNNRARTYNVFINVPLEYVKNYSPKCIRFRIDRDFEVKFDVVQIGSSIIDFQIPKQEDK